MNRIVYYLSLTEIQGIIAMFFFIAIALLMFIDFSNTVEEANKDQEGF